MRNDFCLHVLFPSILVLSEICCCISLILLCVAAEGQYRTPFAFRDATRVHGEGVFPTLERCPDTHADID